MVLVRLVIRIVEGIGGAGPGGPGAGMVRVGISAGLSGSSRGVNLVV